MLQSHCVFCSPLPIHRCRYAGAAPTYFCCSTDFPVLFSRSSSLVSFFQGFVRYERGRRWSRAGSSICPNVMMCRDARCTNHNSPTAVCLDLHHYVSSHVMHSPMKLPLSTGTLFFRSTRVPRTVRLTPSCQLWTPQIQLIQARTYALPFGMEAVKQTIAQNFGGDASHKIVSEDQQFALDQTPNLEGKVAIVTGGSQGIGYGCTHTMLSKGVKKLFILSMTKEVVDGATNAIKEEMGQEVADRVTWLHCDLSDWHQVTEVADKIAKSTDRIDILINNAGRGIMTYQLTSYGIDRHVCWSWNPRSLLHQTDRVPDGPKPHWPCYPHQPSPTNPEEDRRERQHRPHCQYSLECPSGLTIRYEIRVCARIKSRSRTQRPVWKIEACWHPLFPIPQQTLNLCVSKDPRECNPPGLCPDQDVDGRYPRAFPSWRVCDVGGHGAIQKGSIPGCYKYNVRGYEDGEEWAIHLPTSGSGERQ